MAARLICIRASQHLLTQRSFGVATCHACFLLGCHHLYVQLAVLSVVSQRVLYTLTQ